LDKITSMNIFEIIKQFDKLISLPDAIICLTGLILLACWLLKTSLGRNALVDSAPRRNNMPVYLPFIPLFIWFGSAPLVMLITRQLIANLPDWQNALLDNLILSIGATLTIVLIIFLARASFARRLKGFGLNARTIHKDFVFAFINLLSICPLVLAAIVVTTCFGKLIYGQDFYLEQHEELKTIATYTQLPLRILIIITTIMLAPVLEELLFRGLFQTMLRSSLEFRFTNLESRYSSWLSILISSGLFILVHPNAGHWPALFMLAITLGYSYEKSGSLFRPIFIHSFFNSVAIIAVLSQ